MATTGRMTDRFTLDARLAADTALVGDLRLCRVLLMNDRRWPWLILVPRQPDLREIIDLPEPAQMMLLRETAAASRAMQALKAPAKLNVAALGNSVAQLHMHVIARFGNDPAWPKPVWGQGPAIAYPAEALAREVTLFAEALGRIAETTA